MKRFRLFSAAAMLFAALGPTFAADPVFFRQAIGLE